MPTPDDWREAMDTIRETGGVAQSRHLRRLYDLAVADGERVIGGRFRKVPADERRDLVHDALARIFSLLEAAERPRALFITVLTRAAIDRVRRCAWKTQVLMPEVPDVPQQDGGDEGRRTPEGDGLVRERSMRLANLLDHLTPRQREILLDFGEQVPSAETADRIGLTPSNVDQIRHRTLKRLQAAVRGLIGDPEDQR